MKKFILSGLLVFSLVILPGLALAENQLSQLVELLIAAGVIAPDKAAVARAAVSSGQINQSALPTTGSDFCHTWSRNLTLNDRGEDVDALVTALVHEGFIANLNKEKIVGEDYNQNVTSAVTRFQEKYRSEILTPNGFSSGTGNVGPATREKLNALYSCAQNQNQPTAPQTAPAITSLSPTAGPVGTTVVVYGSGFNTASDNVVSISDGVYGTSFRVRAVESTRLTVTIPTTFRVGQTYRVFVDNGLVSNFGYFTVNAAPAGQAAPGVVTAPTLVVSCTPHPTSVGVGAPVTWTAHTAGGSGSNVYTWTGTDNLTGSGATVVKPYLSAGGKTASVSVRSGTQEVMKACGSVTITAAIAAPPTTPIIGSIPSSGNPGSRVTMSGTNFPSTAIIRFEGQIINVINANSTDGTTLSFDVPTIMAGTYSVSVGVSYNNSVIYSTSKPFTIGQVVPPPAVPVSPTVSYISPQVLSAGSKITILGTGFSSSGNTILFSQNNVHTPVTAASTDGGTLSTTLPSSLAAGNYTLTVGNADNKVSGSHNVTVTALVGVPNLIVNTPSFTGTSAGNGKLYEGLMKISFTVSNNGGATAGPSSALLQYSTNNVNYYDWVTVSVPSIQDNSSTLVEHTWTGGKGTYYIKVLKLDSTNAVTESNENDNFSAAGVLEVVPTAVSMRESQRATVYGTFAHWVGQLFK